MKYCLLIWSLLTILQLHAQVLPSEKLFFMSDKMRYEQGDTAWVEGRVIRSDNDTTFVPYSRYVYVELADERDTVLVRQKLVCDSIGNFITRMPIDYWLPGYYYMRAYSKVMANFAPETLPIFPIRIGEDMEPDIRPSDLACSFYPEGGHLVNGHPQNVGIMLTNEHGIPVQQTFRLMDSDGDTLSTQTTTPNGWQVLRFTPLEGRQYHLETDYKGERFTLPLPKTELQPTLQTIIHRNRLVCKVLNPDNKFKRGKLYIYHQSLGLLMLPYKQKDFVMMLNNGLSSGLISIFLTNAKGEFVAQSTQWLDRSQPMDFQLGKDAYRPGESLDYRWSALPDSTSSVFVRFMPKERHYLPKASVMCHYDSDLISEEPFPTHHATPADVEGWLYSARFKRINVPEALDMGILYTKDKEVVMEMQGYAKTKRGKKLRNGSLVAFRESDQQVYDVQLDEQGRFDMFLDDFGADETFFVQAYNRKGKAGVYEYEFYNDTLPGMYNWNRVDKKERKRFTVEVGGLVSAKNFGVNKMNYLPEVVVKAHTRKKQNTSTKKFYSTHYMDAEQLQRRSFSSFRQLVEYFHAFLYWAESDGLDTSTDIQGKRYALYNRRGTSTIEGAEVKILLDGKLITSEQAAYLDVSSLGAVEYLTPSEALAVVPFAVSGALLLDTRRHLGMEEVESKGIVYVPPMGLSNLHLRKTTDEVKVPSTAGEYLLLVDVISQNQGIHSYEHTIVVE